MDSTGFYPKVCQQQQHSVLYNFHRIFIEYRKEIQRKRQDNLSGMFLTLKKKPEALLCISVYVSLQMAFNKKTKKYAE